VRATKVGARSIMKMLGEELEDIFERRDGCRLVTILELDSRIDAYLFHDGDDDNNARWMGYSSMARDALAASRSASSLALSAA